MTITANLKTDIYERRTKKKKMKMQVLRLFFFLLNWGRFLSFFFLYHCVEHRITCCFLCPFHHFRRCAEVRK